MRVGSVAGGYNTRLGQFVVGVDTDLQALDADHMFAAWKSKFHGSERYAARPRLRAYGPGST